LFVGARGKNDVVGYLNQPAAFQQGGDQLFGLYLKFMLGNDVTQGRWAKRLGFELPD